MPAETMNAEVPNEIEIAEEDWNNTFIYKREGVNSQIRSQRNSSAEAGKAKIAGKERQIKNS